MIRPTQRPLPDNTQYLQETNTYAPDGIRTNNPRKRAAADARLRQRGQRDRPVTSAALIEIYEVKIKIIVL
jgi:hypothetical protein